MNRHISSLPIRLTFPTKSCYHLPPEGPAGQLHSLVWNQMFKLDPHQRWYQFSVGLLQLGGYEPSLGDGFKSDVGKDVLG